MTSYTNIFSGLPVQKSNMLLRNITISVDTTLVWNNGKVDTSNTTADTLEVTASVASLSIIMPPANQASKGQGCLFRNLGSEAFTVKDSAGGPIITISAGEAFFVYIRDNSTEEGTWTNIQFGTGTSSADAASLDGLGLIAIGTLLNLEFSVTDIATTQTLVANDRAAAINWTGGAGTLNLTAAATLGDGWFVFVKNSGTGAATIDPDGSETIDGASTLAINEGESALIVTDGVEFFSLMKNTIQTISFSRLSKSVSGSSDVTLTSSEAGYDIQEYTGTLTGNINIIVPTAVSRWWVYNNTSGAFSLTIKTSAGTGIAIAQGTRQILHCDGTNVVKSVDSGSGTVTSVASGTGLTGGPITSSGTLSLSNTAVSPGTYGGASDIPTIEIDAQGRITSASNISLSTSGNVPTGMIAPFAGTSAPGGWLLCAGQAVSRTTYATLFTLISTTYGIGDGSTTFNLPDLRGRTPFGKDNMNSSDAGRLTAAGGIDGDTLGASGGVQTKTLTTTELPSHTHSITDPGHTHSITDPGHTHTTNSRSTDSGGSAALKTVDVPTGTFVGGSATTGISINSATTGISVASSGSGSAFGIIPPGLILNYIIKT